MYLICPKCHDGFAQQIGKFIVCRGCGSKFRLVKIKEVLKKK